jgi:hypothetical protein
MSCTVADLLQYSDTIALEVLCLRKIDLSVQKFQKFRMKKRKNGKNIKLTSNSSKFTLIFISLSQIFSHWQRKFFLFDILAPESFCRHIDFEHEVNVMSQRKRDRRESARRSFYHG